MSPDACARCFYCRMPLGGFHEHDHAPIPQRHGGGATVPTCVNCHNLKDRKPLREWDVADVAQAFEECGPLGRILVAKVFAISLDMRRDLADTA